MPMMIHKCRACRWPIEYPEFMAGSPAKCDECGQMQRLGQRPEDPPEGPTEVSGQPEVSKAKNIFATVVAAVIVLGPILFCIGVCSGLFGDVEPYDERVIVSGMKGFNLDCANDYVKQLDANGVGHLIKDVLVQPNFLTFGTNQKWSRLTKAEKIKTVETFAQAAVEACPSRFNGGLKMAGMDVNGNFSFTYDGPNQIRVND